MFLFVYRVRRGISHDIQDLCLLLEQAAAVRKLGYERQRAGLSGVAEKRSVPGTVTGAK